MESNQDVNFEKKMLEIANYLISNMGNQIDYDKITEFAYEVSGAEYAAFNLFDEDGKGFTTVSLCGISQDIQNAMHILNIDVVGKKWAYDPAREEKIRESQITYFEKIHDLVGDVFPEAIISQLAKSFKIGNVVVAKITKDNLVLGDFTLLFRQGSQLKNPDLFRLYLSQLGLFIEKTRLEKLLRTSQMQFYTLAEYAPVGFISCSTKGEITYANKRLLEIIGSDSLEKTKKINLLEYTPLQQSGFSAKLKEAMDTDKVITSEMPFKSLHDKYTWLRIHFTPNKENDRVVGANIVVGDISDHKKSEADLLEKANRDPLTGAYNRNILDTILAERLNESIDQKLKCCVAMLDVDNFKKINDNYGHRAGDNVLRHLSTRVKQELRTNDLLVRTGGDEFLIYLHDIADESNASRFIKRIFEKISAAYKLDDHKTGRDFSLDVICSMGVSFFPKHGETLEELMAKSDEALYKAKKDGKAKYYVED